MKIILGSSSKWRREVLEKLGYTVEVRKPDIDEKTIRLQDPVELTLALANAKCQRLLKEIDKPAVLVTGDQVVLVDGKIREKPDSEAQAREFLKSSSHQPILAVTSVVAHNTGTGAHAEGTEITSITLRDIDDATIDALIAKGDVMHCCGGFIMEDPLMAPFIVKLDGTKESIMGIPPELTKQLIKEVGQERH